MQEGSHLLHLESQGLDTFPMVVAFPHLRGKRGEVFHLFTMVFNGPICWIAYDHEGREAAPCEEGGYCQGPHIEKT
jgi:hypothetical protein